MPAARNHRNAVCRGALCLCVSLVFLWGCQRTTGHSAHLRQIEFGVQKVLANYPVFLALDRGLFEAQDLEVGIVRFQSANDARDALIAGRIFTDAVMPFQLIFDLEAEAPGSLKCFGAMVATADRPLGILVAGADSKASAPADLAMARVGVYPGTFSSSLTKVLLGPKAGLVQIPADAQAEALSRGEVEALLAYDPMATHLIEDAQARLVERGPWEHQLGPFAVGGYCVSARTLSESPELVSKTELALTEAVSIFEHNPDSALRTVLDEFGLRESDLKEYSVPRVVFGSAFGSEIVKNTYDLYRRAGVTSVEIDPEAILLR